MKRSLDNLDLIEDHDHIKARKSLDFGREDRGDVDRSDVDGSSTCVSDLGGEKEGESTKDVLRRKLKEKQKKKAETSNELDLLESWHKELVAAGFSDEILYLTANHCPLEDSGEPTTYFPDRVLVVYPSDKQTCNDETGPFHPVRLLLHVNGAWSLQCPIYEHIVVRKGKLQTLEDTSSLIELAKDLLCGDNTLCPGMLEDYKDLGYKPENIRIMAGPVKSIHASSCKIWHTPSSRQKVSSKSRSNASDPQWKRVCTECLGVLRYVRKKVKAKKNVDEATKAKRQEPSSHFPWKYLSPGSKSKRARNARQQRSRLKKQVLKFYKRTKIELPGQQSKELCQLIEAIESSENGKKELSKINADGNKHVGKGGPKAGDCISGVWQKARESFFENQRNNGMCA